MLRLQSPGQDAVSVGIQSCIHLHGIPRRPDPALKMESAYASEMLLAIEYAWKSKRRLWGGLTWNALCEILWK